jgi:hypothetical protein
MALNSQDTMNKAMNKDMRKLTITILFLTTSLIGAYTLYRYLLFPNRPDIRNIALSIQIKRLENSLFKLQTRKEIATFLEDNQLVAKEFLDIQTDADKEKVIDQLHKMVQDSAIQALYKEVQPAFKDLDKLRKQLEQAFKCLKYYYPSFEAPEIVTLMTGLGSDLYVSKNLIVIGLDYFLGEKATVRPINMPEYILRTYEPSHIAPKVILLFSQFFNLDNPKDHTLLHDMIYAGKAYYFTKTLLPDVEDSVILGYTSAQLIETEKHQKIVWQHFIDRELFYETNHMVKKKYLGPRPFTAEIGPGCPGNIGGWLGWQIVKRYIKNNPNIQLPTLMGSTDMQNLFMEAKYKPK